MLKIEYGWNFLLELSFSMIMNTINNYFEIPPCAKPFSDLMGRKVFKGGNYMRKYGMLNETLS
jgi:hypothetical protein